MADGCTGTIDQQVLDEIVRRIVEVAAPDKIIMFGSAARGEMGPNSDVDLLVIKSGDYHQGKLSDEIRRSLHGVNEAFDIIVARPDTIERYRDSHCLVYKPALQEGRTIYAPGDAGDRVTYPFQPPTRKTPSSMLRERFAPDDPREWINRAQSNLARAQSMTPGVYLEDLCYDAQQAAEKAIKAVLIHQGVDFPYVHDLTRLLNSVEDHNEPLPLAIRKAEMLTRYAFASRYPGDGDPATEQDYAEAVAAAELVVQWAEDRIGLPKQ